LANRYLAKEIPDPRWRSFDLLPHLKKLSVISQLLLIGLLL
jgi:hypothetical protein